MEQKPFPFSVCAECCNGSDDLNIDSDAIEIVTIRDISSGESSHTFEQILEAHQKGKLVLVTAKETVESGEDYEINPIESTGIATFIDDERCVTTFQNGNTSYRCVIQSDYGNMWDVFKTELATESDVSSKENISNKVTELTSENTDEEYPSAKAVAGAVFSKADKPLIVNVIEEDGNYSSAETFEEIYNAYRLEREVIAVVNSGYVVYRMVQINKNRVVFGALTSNVYTSIEYNSSNIWKVYNIRFSDEDALIDALSNIDALALNKEDKPSIIVDKEATEYTINLSEKNNHIIRLGMLDNLTFITGYESTKDIPEEYGLDISFFTGSTPTAVNTAECYHVYWIGVDCDAGIDNGFHPVANKNYDIVFYKNGSHLIGMVNGYSAILPMPPTGPGVMG